MMTFAQFQATRTECADIGAAIGADFGGQVSGLLYAGQLYIEKLAENFAASGCYQLVIFNEQWVSNDLAMLERRLYDFGRDEGYCGTLEEATREQLAFWYADVIGYDPFTDSPTITVDEVRATALEHQREAQA
jgi:hypothetical protein